MGKYICEGNTTLQFPGRPVVRGGETFAIDLPADQEAALLACGAITIANPPSPSLAPSRSTEQTVGPADAGKE